MKVAIIGCGNRGADVYARHLAAEGAEIAALVDTRPARLAQVAARYPAAQTFGHWQDFFALGKVADAVVIATPDDAHVLPCLTALALDYDVLLEKPVALSLADIDALLEAEAHSKGRVSVCHVLRHTAFFQAIHAALPLLGQLVAIDIHENVAYWHYAHSYVRGNWRESPPAAPFLLAKSCHDLDILRWWAAAAPKAVQSMGALHHFRPEHKPAGAAERCVHCAVPCPYDARKIYLMRPADVWPNTVLTAGGLSVQEALEMGPYGECVYLGKNNVNDHQQLAVTFEGGVQGALTTSAFTHNNARTLKVQGSLGELRGDMESGELELHNFINDEVTRWSVDVAGNHGGGDLGLVRAWLAALRGEAALPTPLAESLDSHRMALWQEQ